jgi:hypothetical protein
MEDLPIELYRQIPAFLLSYAILGPEEIRNSVDIYLIRESNRSWRNFLSVKNCESWKQLRKSTMIWSFNPQATTKYLENEQFRNYILERTTDPISQIRLQPSDEIGSPTRFMQLRGEFIVNRIGFLCFSTMHFFNSQNLPNCDSLHTLILDHCTGLKGIGSYKNLKTLKIVSCIQLATLGKMETLSELYFSAASKGVLSQCPLQSLTRLALYEYVTFFLEKIDQLANLNYLFLSAPTSRAVELPQLSLPVLQQLIVRKFKSIDLTGLLSLTHFDVDSMQCQSIRGKEEIYPRLSSLRGMGDAFAQDDMRNYPNVKVFQYSLTSDASLKNLSQYENIPSVKIHSSTTLKPAGMFHIGPAMRSLEVNLGNVTVWKPNQSKISKLDLSLCRLENFTNFPYLQCLSLSSCSSLTTLIPFKEVRYLSIEDCSRITDFSCLGPRQRFLTLKSCAGLKDADILSFNSVAHLTISYCENITRVRGLHDTRFLYLSHCKKLAEVSLNGRDYVVVDLNDCSVLGTLVVSSVKIYSLKVSSCRSLRKEKLTNYYEYLDFLY